MAKKQEVTIYSCITDDEEIVRMSTHPDLTSDNTGELRCPVFAGPVLAFWTCSGIVEAGQTGWNSCRSSVEPCASDATAMFEFDDDEQALSWLLGEKTLDEICVDDGKTMYSDRRRWSHGIYADGKMHLDFIK